MNIDLDYKTFCDTYYDAAVEIADITIAEHIKARGQLNPYIDVALVKDLGISYGLEKVYNTFDVDHGSRANIKTYMSTVIRNCVLTELGKESTAVCAKKRQGMPTDSMLLAAAIKGRNASLESFRETFRTSGRFQKKEDLIAKMLECLMELDGVDQVILRCWMVYPKGEYTDMAIEELGWDDNKRTRNVVNVRCNRAIAKLGKMMEGARSDYRDACLPKSLPISELLSEQELWSDSGYNFVSRRQMAARKNIASGIDYRDLAKSLSSRLPD